MMDRHFTVEILDYSPGKKPDPLTTDRMEHLIEQAVSDALGADGSDGGVIVKEQPGR
jgi:hypothetical protein